MIVKTVIQLVILQEADSLQAAEERIAPMGLADLAYLIEEDDGIGAFSTTAHDAVAPADLEAELLALGNDGTFFGDDEEDEEG